MNATPVTAPALSAPRGRSRNWTEPAQIEWAILFLVGALRVGTLVVGAAEAGTTRHRAAGLSVLVILGAWSAIVFGYGLSQRPGAGQPRLGRRAASVETVAVVVSTIVMGHYTLRADLTTSSFWLEPYAVISCILIAASIGLSALGIVLVAAISGGYAVAVGPVLTSGAASTDGVAAALSNLASCPAFYLLTAIAFGIMRQLGREAHRLRALAGQLPAEQARLTAARSAYRIGHDIPKQFLRELRLARLPGAELSRWARRFHGDLLTALGGTGDRDVDLLAELNRVVATFAEALPVVGDVEDTLANPPAGTPRLLLVEATRELLNNAAYHRFGYEIAVVGRNAGGVVTIRVRNEGPGVDTRRLVSAWSRKQSTVHLWSVAGGQYRLESGVGPDAGLTVTLSYPVDGAAQGAQVPPPNIADCDDDGRQ